MNYRMARLPFGILVSFDLGLGQDGSRFLSGEEFSFDDHQP
jgi:hypothetical protein